MKWWPWHDAHREALDELRRTEANLETVQGRWPEVHQASRRLDAHRAENGFAEKIREAMGVQR